MLASISVANKSVLFATGAAAGATFFAITDAVAISIVTSTSAVIMAGISAYFAHKAKTIAEATGKAVDGHLTEFKAMAKTSFTAEGVLQEKAAETIRKADATASVAEGVAKEKEAEKDKKAVDSVAEEQNTKLMADLASLNDLLNTQAGIVNSLRDALRIKPDQPSTQLVPIAILLMKELDGFRKTG